MNNNSDKTQSRDNSLTERNKPLKIKVNVRDDFKNEPVVGILVKLLVHPDNNVVGAEKTNNEGSSFFTLENRLAKTRCTLDNVFVEIFDTKGKTIFSTKNTPIRLSDNNAEINILISHEKISESGKENVRQKIDVGPFKLDAEAVQQAEPQIVFDIAALLVNKKIPEESLRRISELSKDLIPGKRITLCSTDILLTIEELIKIKKWPREVAIKVDDILALRDEGFTEETYNCPNFTITYQTSGAAAVDPDTSSQDVIDPGSSPAVVLGNLPAGSPPTYIKRICFWLERALSSYVSAPFSMRNPAAAGRIPVVVNSSPYGSASSSGTFYLNNALPPDLLCAVAVHELFHMVQFQYGGSGTWVSSMLEGGAVFAEDTAADFMNRYLDESGTNFNGIGVLSNTNQDISSSPSRYKSCLFWRYISEQQSSDLTEPFIGVETYRKIIEECSTPSGSWSTDDIKRAIRSLPWYQDFYEFGYLDPLTKLDRTSSETTLGNYILACYLKDLGTNVPDSRFDFIEDEENIYIDDVLRSTNPSLPSQTTLASPTLAGSGNVTTSTSVNFSSSVTNFGTRYYEISINPSVTNINIQFNAGSGLTSSIFQIVLIEGGTVRDIHRTDKLSYTKRITNSRNGNNLSKIMLAVTGANSGGNFSISAASASPAPDVMVTKWHSAIKTEYEIDSKNWAWTWVSPDIWVDNNNDGIADDQVYFNYDNKLHIRLHNKGNVDANGIGVEFYYQDASGGLSSSSWLPVQNTSGITQTLSGLSLSSGTTDDWTVDWSPAPSGMSKHFCIRAIISVPGDPNSDNKRVLSNFGNVVTRYGKAIDVSLVRRNPFDKPIVIRQQIVPRFGPDFEIYTRDINENKAELLQPHEIRTDTLRIRHKELKSHYSHRHNLKEEKKSCHEYIRRLEISPDPTGNYPTDPRSLPPGVEGRPMLTVVHEVDGLPTGGVSFLVNVEKSDDKQQQSE